MPRTTTQRTASRDPDEIRALRSNTARAHDIRYREVLEVRTCPETGAAVAIVQGRGETVAMCFKPRAYRRIHKVKKLVSAHDRRLALKSWLADLAAAKAQAKAPHDLAVGEIIAEIWGHSMRDVRFYAVVDIPSPKTVALASLGERLVSGDWMCGEREPALRPADLTADAPRYTYRVSMASGEAEINMGSSISCAQRWSGKPISVWSD